MIAARHAFSSGLLLALMLHSPTALARPDLLNSSNVPGALNASDTPKGAIDADDVPKRAIDSNNVPKGAIDADDQPKGALNSSDASGVDPKLCNALTKASVTPDLAYQPGVDVHGKAIAPADLQGGSNQITVPSKIDIPLTIGLANVLHLDTSHMPGKALGTGTEGWIGTLTVDGDKVLYNGQPLSGTQQDNLSVLCLKQGNH